MNINKEELQGKFIKKDWNYVFRDALEISNFVALNNFGISNEEVRKDVVQDCCLNLYKQILNGKVDPSKNIFAFIWQNSAFRIQDSLRKEKRGGKIEFVEFDSNNIDHNAEME